MASAAVPARVQVTPTLAVNFTAYEMSKTLLTQLLHVPADTHLRAQDPPLADAYAPSSAGGAPPPQRVVASGGDGAPPPPQRRVAHGTAEPRFRTEQGTGRCPHGGAWPAPTLPSPSGAGDGWPAQRPAPGIASAAEPSSALSKALISLAAGSFAGVASSTLTFPLDVVRRNLQANHGASETYMQVR